MPTLTRTVEGKVEKVYVPDQDVPRYMRDGWAPAPGTTLNIKEGIIAGTIEAEHLEEDQVLDSAILDRAEVGRRALRDFEEDVHGGLANKARALGLGVARGLTLGGSDVIAEGLGADPEMLQALREHHSGTSMIGEIGGAVVPAFFTGGGSAAASASRVGSILAHTPAGLALRAGGAIARRGAGRGLTARAAFVAAGGATEGAFFGGGQAVSEMVLENKELTAESFLAAAGSGALLGAGVGGGLVFGGAALRAAKRAGGKLSEAIRGAVSKQVDDALLRSPIREAERAALEKSGRALAETAEEQLKRSQRAVLAGGNPALSTGQRLAIQGKREALATAETTLGNAAGDDVFDAVEGYHRAADDLHQSLEAVGVKSPGAPPAIRAVAEGLDIRLADVVEEKAAKASVDGAKKDLSRAAVELDAAGERAIAEAAPLSEARNVAARELGSTMDEIVEQVGAVDDFKVLVAKAEKARDGFRKIWQTVDGEAEDAAMERILASKSDEFTKAAKAYDDYDRAVRALNDHIDTLAPSPQGPRNATLPEGGGLNRPNRPAPDTSKWDVGDYLAVADLAGLKIDQLPVVGDIPGLAWILQARMAMRRLKGVRAKLMGDGAKAGAIATRAQAYKSRLVAAVKVFMGKVKPLARGKVPAAILVLNGLSYGDKGSNGKTEEEAFNLRADELSEAMANPSATKAKIRSSLPKGAGELGDLIADMEWGKLSHLYQVMPKDPRTPMPAMAPWLPDAAELDTWTERAWVAEHPAAVFDLLARNELTVEGADTFKTVYPTMFAELVTEILDAATGLEDLPHERQVQLSTLFDMPIVFTEDPHYVAAMQAGYVADENRPPEGQPVGGNPSMAGLTKIAPEGSVLDTLMKT